MNHLSLFSGIGGLDLAAEMAGFTAVGQCEWADYPTKVLEKHWPDVPRWKDIRTLTGESFYEKTGDRTLDCVSGGFPCQPHSLSGKRLASHDERDLWGVSSASFAKLTPNGLWQKMCQGFCQVKMEGFSDEFYGTWPTWGVMRSGTVFLPTLPVRNFGVSGSPLWPRPIASDSIAWMKVNASNPRISIAKVWNRHGQDRPIYDFMWNGVSATQAAEYHEMMMGFPPHWTDLNASETP